MDNSKSTVPEVPKRPTQAPKETESEPRSAPLVARFSDAVAIPRRRVLSGNSLAARTMSSLAAAQDGLPLWKLGSQEASWSRAQVDCDGITCVDVSTLVRLNWAGKELWRVPLAANRDEKAPSWVRKLPAWNPAHPDEIDEREDVIDMPDWSFESDRADGRLTTFCRVGTSLVVLAPAEGVGTQERGQLWLDARDLSTGQLTDRITLLADEAEPMHLLKRLRVRAQSGETILVTDSQRYCGFDLVLAQRVRAGRFVPEEPEIGLWVLWPDPMHGGLHSRDVGSSDHATACTREHLWAIRRSERLAYFHDPARDVTFSFDWDRVGIERVTPEGGESLWRWMPPLEARDALDAVFHPVVLGDAVVASMGRARRFSDFLAFDFLVCLDLQDGSQRWWLAAKGCWAVGGDEAQVVTVRYSGDWDTEELTVEWRSLRNGLVEQAMRLEGELVDVVGVSPGGAIAVQDDEGTLAVYPRPPGPSSWS